MLAVQFQKLKLSGGALRLLLAETLFLVFRQSQDLGPFNRNCNRVLGVGGEAAVCSNHRPLVLECPCFLASEVEHRLDRKAIPGPNLLPRSLATMVWNLGSLVH